MKRFWKQASATPGGGIALDGRPVRTPGRAPLIAPTAALADAIAAEWQAGGEDIDPRAMPLTGLANAAIDLVAPDPAAFAAGLARYGESDLLCYRAAQPPALAARQATVWNPLIAWAERRYDIHLVVATGIVHRPQAQLALERLGNAVAALDPFALAALSPVVTVTGSLLLALALIEGEIDPDAAWAAAHVDEDWQASLWGEDTLAAQARAAKRGEFDAAVRFLSLSRRQGDGGA